MKLLVCYNTFLRIFIICNSDNIMRGHIFEKKKKCVFDLGNYQCHAS